MINQFINEVERMDRSTHTISGYRTELKKFEAWLHETSGETLNRVTDLDVKDYKQYLLNTKKQKPATVNRGLKVLSMFYNWAVGQGLLQYNPTAKINPVQVQQAAPKWLDRNDINKLKRIVLLERNPVTRARDYAILLLMSEAGLRVFEVAALVIKDVLITDRKGIVIIRKGKGSKYREVPLNKNIRQALNQYLELRKPNANESLFLGERGPMTKRAIQHRMEKYRKNAGIEATAHQLRHTFCHELIKEGQGLQVVAQLAGHSNINTTKVYVTPSERELLEAVESLAIE